jgi:hypothetical protein
MQDTVLRRLNGTTRRFEKPGMHNRSESSRGARVALRVHATHAYSLIRSWIRLAQEKL